MVCMTDDLQEWKDFPKGLRVLLLDRDSRSATEIRSNLEEMEYLVHSYCDEKEALSAILSTPGSFHVAIVEVCTGNYEESFKFLETAKDLPIIMTSNIHCLSTMMKCIALGAVEFLLKPLSEDKLRNIWQHVLHKAFSDSPKPVEESVVSLLQLQLENENENEISEDMEYLSWFQDNEHEQPVASDKLPAPATPQLDQGARLLDSRESQDQMNCSMETECMEKDGQSKFVETTSIYLVGEGPLQEGQPRSPRKTTVEEDKNFVVDSKGESNIDHDFHNKTSVKNICAAAENSIQGSDANHSAGFKADRKKMKVDWTPELHRKFVLAVEQLGIDYAIPSKILELMKVEKLTRHNVASHLQKYRIQKKHVIHREEDPRWLHPRGLMQTNHLKPIMAYPPYHSNCGMSMSSVYPTWRQTIGHPANVQMWGPHAYHHWQQPQILHRNTYTEVRADAWGCPVMMPSHSPYLSYPQHISASHNMQTLTNGNGMPNNSFDLQPDEEMVDKVVKEAMSMPWSPLPLGLKPPSTEGVLSELSRQGISTIPPHINSPNLLDPTFIS